MLIDTTTDEKKSSQANETLPKNSSSVWKQEVVSQNPLMGKLLQPEFDQANFLYNMYKSCTVGEIEDFKYCLQEIREGTVVSASRDSITSKSSQISQLVKDIIQVDTQVKLKIAPSMTKLDETSLKIQHSLLAQIEELQSQASRLVMTQKCEEIIRESQLVYECLQKVSYAYNFAQRKILDPLSLSTALKKLGVLSSEQKQKLATNIPQVATKLELLADIQSHLEQQTLAKFQEAFDNKDRQTLVQCIQVFFNMEILSDQIQQRTNVYLKQLHTFWQKNIKELNDKIQKQESQSDEAQLVDRSLGVFINQMTQSTLKVYTMSLALSEQDPTSATATSFEAMQETLQQTGLSNVFRLYWDMLCKILRVRLQAASQEFPYVYSAMAARYPAFIISLNHFWQQVLSQVQPTDKIRLLELKQSIFASVDILKQCYFDNNILKQLMEYRLQISEVLNNSFENLDKYKIVAQKQQSVTDAPKIINPYTAMNDSLQSPQDLKTQEKALLSSSVGGLLAAIHLHLETVSTQLDLRNQVVEICKGQLNSLLQTDLLNNIVKFQITETQEYEHQLAFNIVIFDLAKQVAQYFSSSRFQDLLEADEKLHSSASMHMSKEFQLKNLMQEAQDMCGKLFEKVYVVFISHFKTKIYPALVQIFQDMPKPLQEDDLDFGCDQNDDEHNESQEADEDEKNKENSLSFQERLEAWQKMHTEDLFSEFIPDCIKDFNSDFASILEKMSLDNLVTPSNQWIQRDRKIRMIECVDEMLHFFMLRAIQIDYNAFTEEQRNQVHCTLSEMYASLAQSFSEFVQIELKSRMVQKHQAYLALVKEGSGYEEKDLPIHISLCLAQPTLKTISLRNLYICERSKLRAQLLGQPQIVKNAVTTYEKTMQDIRKVFAALSDGELDAQTLILQEEKLTLIDAKLSLIAKENKPEENQSSSDK